MFKFLMDYWKAILAAVGLLWTVVTAALTFLAAFIDFPKLYEAFGFVHITRYESDLKSAKNQGVLSKSAVVGFDVDTTDGTTPACPDGWTWFRQTGGRFLIGAGQHQNKWFPEGSTTGVQLQRYDSFSSDPHSDRPTSTSTGGEEEHTLLRTESFSHGHTKNRELDYLKGNKHGDKVPGITINHENLTHDEIGERIIFPDVLPHNNMPPYIALYFCKKD